MLRHVASNIGKLVFCSYFLAQSNYVRDFQIEQFLVVISVRSYVASKWKLSLPRSFSYESPVSITEYTRVQSQMLQSDWLRYLLPIP